MIKAVGEVTNTFSRKGIEREKEKQFAEQILLR